MRTNPSFRSSNILAYLLPSPFVIGASPPRHLPPLATIDSAANEIQEGSMWQFATPSVEQRWLLRLNESRDRAIHHWFVTPEGDPGIGTIATIRHAPDWEPFLTMLFFNLHAGSLLP